MVLRNVREEFGEDWTENARQHIDRSGSLAYLHDAKPQGQYAREAQRGLKSGLGRVEGGLYHVGEYLRVAHEAQFHQPKEEGNDEIGYPNVI